MERLRRRTVRSLLFAVLLVLLTVPLSAESIEPGWWGSYYTPGNVSAGLLTAADFNYGLSLDVYPNVEFKFYKWRPGNFFAVDFGAGLRGAVNLYTGDNFYPGYFGLGLGPYVSWHLGFRGLRNLGIEALEYLEPLDLFSTVGLSFHMFSGDNPPGSGLSFSGISGMNYFLTDNLAVTAFTSVAGISGLHTRRLRGGIGLLLKWGPKERLGDAPDIAFGFGEPLYMYFQAYYMMAIGLSGPFFDDVSFQPGDETELMYRITEDGDAVEFTIIRTLLERNAAGTESWWRVQFIHPDMEKDRDWPDVFELLTNASHDILKVRYIDPNNQRLSEYVPDDPARWRRNLDFSSYDPEAMEDYFVRTDSVTVPAGTFTTDLYRYTDGEYDVEYWISSDVPGLLVQIDGTYRDGDELFGQLQEIRRGVVSPW
ncbi:hypothetical protein [Spirochaeta dissipatitropha]